MKEITVEWLQKNGACAPRIKRFKKVFGEKAKVNYENATLWRKRTTFWRDDFHWLIRRLLFPVHAGSKNMHLVNKLGHYLKLIPHKEDSFFFLDVVRAVLNLKQPRFTNAFTQIVYLAK